MNKTLSFVFTCLLLLGGMGPLPPLGAAVLPAQVSEYYHLLAPTGNQVRTDKDIMKFLAYRHYRYRKVDDTLSSEVFDRYLEDLDPNRLYFLAADIQQFEPHRYTMDEALKAGDLKASFAIYNRFQQRMVERLLFMLEMLGQGAEKMPFDVDESLELERKEAPWPADSAEQDELWRKRLKNNVLGLRLAGKTWAEIEKSLSKRYKNQLNKFKQARDEDAFQAYMNSVTGVYDPHTQYFSPRRSENFDINMSLSFEGIGAVLTIEDEYVKILRLVPAGPAEKTKQLNPADRIVSVGQADKGELVDVVGWRIDEVVQLIRGPKGSVVRLEVIPIDAKDDHDTKVVRIVRNTVKLEEQSAQKKILQLKRGERTHTIGVIDIPTFYVDFKAMQAGAKNYKSTTSDVRRLLGELVVAGVDGIVVDLRDNGGGSLQEANSLTGLFIKQGPTVQIRNVDGRVNILRDPDPAIAYDGPLVVLVNRLSASASEIFAGAIQDYKRGIIVGEQTFGKGTVQALYSLTQGQLKNTSAKFYRITGESTQHKGVDPDLYYPSLYDSQEIGESSLDGALPWDKIQSLFYRPYLDSENLVGSLEVRHKERMKGDVAYDYLLERLDLQKKARQETVVSLSESARRLEYQEVEEARLALENRLRAARKLPLLENLADLEEEEAHSVYDGGADLDPADDGALVESGKILLDLIDLIPTDLAQH